MKKALTLILTVALLLNCFVLFCGSAETVTPDGNAEPGSAAYTAWLVEQGYVSVERFDDIIVSNGSVKYYLTHDIVLPDDYVPLSAGTYYIDGNGFTLYRYKRSLINNLTGGVVKNLSVSKFVSAEEEAKGDNGETVGCTSAVFGSKIQDATLINVVVDIEFTLTSRAGYMGMFAREAYTPATFIRCVNRSSAIGSPDPDLNGMNFQHAAVYGGFISYANGNKNSDPEKNKFVFEDCVNFGDISGSHAGGFIGTITDGGGSDGCPASVTMIRCVNYGKITGLFDAGGCGKAGGLIGAFGGWGAGREVVRTNCVITLDHCENYGDVVRYSIEEQEAAYRRWDTCAIGGLIGFAGVTKNDYENDKTFTATHQILIDGCRVENVRIKGESPWEDANEQDYTQGYAAALIGRVENNLDGDSLVIRNSVVNNVYITSGDPDSASIFVNYKSECNKAAEIVNTVAFNCTEYKHVACGPCHFTTDGGSSAKVTVDKAQLSVPEDGKAALRFLGTIDSMAYSDVACIVTETIGEEVTYYLLSAKEVYESVNAMTRALTKADFSGKPITALALPKTVATDVTATYEIIPYAMTFVAGEAGEILFGASKTATLTNGVLS